jgi:hypothetical protein
VKKLNEKKDAKADEEPKIQITDKVDKRDSSGSDTDDPDNPESRTSVLFMQVCSSNNNKSRNNKDMKFFNTLL